MFQWLKNLFIKKDKEEFDCSIDKKYWKKNWLGLTKIYESYDPKYKWCFIKITSHLSEDDCIEDYRNTLTIGIGGSYKKWLLPFSFIKPILDYHHYVKDDKGNDTDVIKWSTYVERTYQISIVRDEGYFSFKWNYSDDFLYNTTKHNGYDFWYWFFWKNSYRSKDELLNLDGTLYKDISDWHKTLRLKTEEENAILDGQPKIIFNVLDYDQQPLTVTGKLTRMTYRKGNGIFTKFLMKLLTKPKVYTTLEMEFEKEIGRNKGSYKGGTTGQGVHLLTPDESIVDAFKRYCYDPKVRGFRSTNIENLTYLGHKKIMENGITDEVEYTEVGDTKFYNILIMKNNIHVDEFQEYYKDEDLAKLPCIFTMVSVDEDNKIYQDFKEPHTELYQIEVNEKDYSINVLLYRMLQATPYLTKLYYKHTIVELNTNTTLTLKEELISNGQIKYYFTKQVKDYLIEHIDHFKYVNFIPYVKE